MKVAVLREKQPRLLTVVFDPDEEAASGLVRVAEHFKLAGSSFTGIGAFSSATLGYFDRVRKDYRKIEVREQVEVLAMTGNIALHNGEAKVHAHVVAGKSDGTAIGGHMLKCTVWPTLEITVVEPEVELRRTFVDEVKLPLIDLSGSHVEEL